MAQDDFSAGLARLTEGRIDDAIALFERAVSADAPHIDAHHALGLTLAKAGRVTDAIDRLTVAVGLAPGNRDIRAALISLLVQGCQWRTAADHLALMPQDADTLADRALCLNALGRFDEALALTDLALELTPGHGDALNNRGVAFDGLERLTEAEAALRQAPPSAPVLNNLGRVLRKCGRIDEALTCYDAVLAADPDAAQTHFNRAHALLLGGRLRDGWADYEWRLNGGNPAAVLGTFDQPRWRGEAFAGKTLLIHAEQGFGDSLQFYRFVPQVMGKGRVILEVPKALAGLLATQSGAPAIVAKGDPLPPFDLECPMLSLAHELAVDLADIDPGPTLTAPPALTARWRDRLSATPEPRIGLVWAGSRHHANDRNRSVPFDRLEPLWRVPGLSWFSLQTEAEVIWSGPGQDLGPQMHSFEDSAAIVANLNAVVTVDTAMAHLAGALGVPCLVMLPHAPDWRWLLGRDDSPWYAKTRLFRQPKSGDWDAVIKAVADYLPGLTG